MAYTKFGEFMRILRVKHHEVMGDIAKLLDVKVSFVSAVENGKRNVPSEWKEKIINHYNLNQEEQKELIEAINDSKTQVKFNLVDILPMQRNAVLQFQRSFDSIDDETATKIIELLGRNNSN